MLVIHRKFRVRKIQYHHTGTFRISLKPQTAPLRNSTDPFSSDSRDSYRESYYPKILGYLAQLLFLRYPTSLTIAHLRPNEKFPSGLVCNRFLGSLSFRAAP